uniref:tetratricopeptide repeat protein n=1 Tax=Flavobacterium sp. TaxID=239 RepID=UPI00404B784F
MRKILYIILLFQFSCKSQEDCPEGTNLLPMYGDVQKCEQQIAFDNELIAESEKLFGNRKNAAEKYVSKGWECFYKNDYETSMKRFNQAWLLDSSNPAIYWGFGILMGKKSEFEQSVKYLQKSIEIDRNNAKVYECIATSYGQIFFKTKDIKHLNLSIENLKKAIKIEPNNGSTYGQLANAYAYLKQKDSLKKYIRVTDEIDPKFVNPEDREILNNE